MAQIYYISGVGKRYAGMGAVITANTQPDYDDWGPDEYWGCTEWKAWHMALVESLGLAAANIVFKTAWDKQDSFSGPYNWCKYDAAWVNYFLSNGLDLRSIVSAIIVPVVSLPGNVVQTGSNVITNTTGAAESLSKLIKPVSILALGALAYYGYKTYMK